MNELPRPRRRGKRLDYAIYVLTTVVAAFYQSKELGALMLGQRVDVWGSGRQPAAVAATAASGCEAPAHPPVALGAREEAPTTPVVAAKMGSVEGAVEGLRPLFDKLCVELGNVETTYGLEAGARPRSYHRKRQPVGG